MHNFPFVVHFAKASIMNDLLSTSAKLFSISNDVLWLLRASFSKNSWMQTMRKSALNTHFFCVITSEFQQKFTPLFFFRAFSQVAEWKRVSASSLDTHVLFRPPVSQFGACWVGLCRIRFTVSREVLGRVNAFVL